MTWIPELKKFGLYCLGICCRSSRIRKGSTATLRVRLSRAVKRPRHPRGCCATRRDGDTLFNVEPARVTQAGFPGGCERFVRSRAPIISARFWHPDHANAEFVLVALCSCQFRSCESAPHAPLKPHLATVRKVFKGEVFPPHSGIFYFLPQLKSLQVVILDLNLQVRCARSTLQLPAVILCRSEGRPHGSHAHYQKACNARRWDPPND